MAHGAEQAQRAHVTRVRLEQHLEPLLGIGEATLLHQDDGVVVIGLGGQGMTSLRRQAYTAPSPRPPRSRNR